MTSQPRIAVLIPCYNEEVAIGMVVRDFRAALPGAAIYVFDNNSRDRTVEVAREAGAIVRRVPLQGKGNVVRRMFADARNGKMSFTIDGRTGSKTILKKILYTAPVLPE